MKLLTIYRLAPDFFAVYTRPDHAPALHSAVTPQIAIERTARANAKTR